MSGLLASYLVAFLSDRAWDTPVWLRCALSAAGVGVLVWMTARWARDWILQRRDLRALADLVQKRFRRLGDRLLGVVELASEAQRPVYFSPELYRAAIDQVSSEAKEYDFREAVNVQAARKQMLTAAALLLLTLL